MILRILRIPLTVLFGWAFYRSLMNGADLAGGGIIAVMAFGLIGAIGVAVLWAPVIGEQLSEPLTSTFTTGTSLPQTPNNLVHAINRLQARRWHRLALLLVFAEGLRHPELPHPSLLGLRSVRPGSWLERWFAREIYRFSNIQNCLHAYTILKERHGITPPPHRQPEVNLAILSLTRERPPTPNTIPMGPSSPQPKPPRNKRIRLFSRGG